MFSTWRDLDLERSVKDAAGRGVRYAGMGAGHLKPLVDAGVPADTHVFNMSGDEIGEFDDHTRELAKIAVKQR